MVSWSETQGPKGGSWACGGDWSDENEVKGDLLKLSSTVIHIHPFSLTGQSQYQKMQFGKNEVWKNTH